MVTQYQSQDESLSFFNGPTPLGYEVLASKVPMRSFTIVEQSIEKVSEVELAALEDNKEFRRKKARHTIWEVPFS